MNAAVKLYEEQRFISYPLVGSRDEKDAKRPYSNTGERYSEEGSPADPNSGDTAFIDFLTVVMPTRDLFRFDKFDGLEDFASAVCHYFLNPIHFTYDVTIKGGRNGYKNHWKIQKSDKNNQSIEVGYFCFGGNNDTLCISLTGTACQSIGKDGFSFIRDFIEEQGGHITRVDLAHDCFNGEVSIDDVHSWYNDGLFKASARGKYPNAQKIDDLGSGKGCTFYVGSRESGKYFRAYEKGKQLGDKNSPWVRLELELLNKKRGIPYEILDKVAEYLAGGYECLEHLSVEQSRIKTLQKSTEVSYFHLEGYARQSYGRFIDIMLQVYEGCPATVIEQLRRTDAPPKRLITASIPVKQ